MVTLIVFPSGKVSLEVVLLRTPQSLSCSISSSVRMIALCSSICLRISYCILKTPLMTIQMPLMTIQMPLMTIQMPLIVGSQELFLKIAFMMLKFFYLSLISDFQSLLIMIESIPAEDIHTRNAAKLNCISLFAKNSGILLCNSKFSVSRAMKFIPEKTANIANIPAHRSKNTISINIHLRR